MALPTPPPPSDTSPSATTSTAVPATTATAHALRPPFPPNPRLAHPHPIYNTNPFYSPHMMHPPHLLNLRHTPPHEATTSSPAPPNPAALYPVVSSGRGLLKMQVPISHTNPNSHQYPDRSGFNRPLYGYPQSDPGQAPGMGFVSGRPTHLQQQPGGVMPGVPVPSTQGQRKMTVPSTLNADSNGHRDARERSKDESSVVHIRDRKVTMSESASLYSLCRSWIKNGPPEEIQPVFTHLAQSFPKPSSPAKKVDVEEEVKEEGSVENLSPEELLQTHIRRAKRVRSRLREERRRRIDRHKSRLNNILNRNDQASGK